MQGIAFTKSLENAGHQSGKRIIALNISRELLNRILHPHNGTELTSLGIDNTYAVNIFDAEIDILEDIRTLATSTKGIDRNSHADTNEDNRRNRKKCKHTDTIL